jgi:hypothetical protein
MNKLLAILFTIIYCSDALTQQQELDQFNNILLRAHNDNAGQNLRIEGSPYTSGEMRNGTIHFISDQEIRDIPLRYNWYTREMEVMYKGTLHCIPPIKDIDYIQIGDDRYVPFHNLKEVQGFLIQLYQGKYSLFMGEDIRFIEATHAQSGYDEAQPAQYKSYGKEYYGLDPDGNFFKLAGKTKKLAHQFPDKQNDILLIIKKNKLNVKKKPDLIKLFQMLDQ